jgi:hypothetical protein
VRFKLGDEVKWTSQAQGYTREKRGPVVQVLAPGEKPDPERFPALNAKTYGNLGRNHESYVVHVEGHGNYWPLVSKLELVEPPKPVKWAPAENYAARKRECGCIVGLTTNHANEPKETARAVADWIRRGFSIEPITTAEIRDPDTKLSFRCKCQPAKSEEDERQGAMFA